MFRKPRSAQEGELLQDRWGTSFRFFQKKRIPAENAPQYRGRTQRGAYHLQISKRNCFAWVAAPQEFRYQDVVLEGRLRLGSGNGYSAAGFALRYINEENFYYFLISNHGYFRFDVLFNRSPIHLIDWTEYKTAENLDIRIICRDRFFAFFIEDEWVAEVEDHTLLSGSFGFAAQNFDERGQADFYLESLILDARPVEVEKAYSRWVHYVPADPQNRLNLGKTFFSMGDFQAAVYQVRKALPHRATAEVYLFLAECLIKSERYEQALENIDHCLELGGEREAQLEKANVLFLLHRYLETRDYIRSILTANNENPLLWNTLGNCEYSLGNWQQAADAYQQSVKNDAEAPLYLINLARAQERLGLIEPAFLNYLEASRLYFRREEYEELALIVPRARELVGESGRGEVLELQALEGKMLYHEGNISAAADQFKKLIDSGHQDSAVYFLYGLIQVERGQRLEAAQYLEQAVNLEPEYGLYQFKLAENRHLLGEDPAEALDQALNALPEDPWVNNLHGLVLIKQSQLRQALACFERARELAPAEADIYRNLAQAHLELAQPQQALQTISAGIASAGAKAVLLNQRGTILVALGDLQRAMQEYERALRLEPQNREILENCAACCIELDMILRAEELLARLLEGNPSAAVYNLNGNLALLQREFHRAEASYTEALKLVPGDVDISCNLIGLHVETNAYEEAKTLLDRVLKISPAHPKALELQSQIRKRFERSLSCADCGRVWWVPQNLSSQPGFTLHGEPPGEAPAGACQSCGRIFCVSCASGHVHEGRLKCKECRGELRLSSDALKYLMMAYVDGE